MFSSARRSPGFLLLGLSLSLAACGGGGGGGGDDDSSANFTADRPITITEQNSPQVVAEATDSSVGSGLDSPLSAAFRSDTGNAVSDGQANILRGIVKGLVETTLNKRSVGARTVDASETEECAIDGTVTFSFTGEVDDETGDGTFSGTVTADECSDVAGEFIDGAFTIRGDLVAGELDETLTATFRNFTVRSPDGNGSINGTMLVTIEGIH